MADHEELGLDPETLVVFQRREAEAFEAGLSPIQAAQFAANGQDVGLLRSLVAHGCAPALIAAIVL
jgi:hypothetical protein